MPIYEYRCKSEDKAFEAFQLPSEPILSSCPECGGEVEKLMSLGAFHLKGSGWYSTDYKAPAAKAEKKESEGGPAAKTSAKAEGSSSKESGAEASG